MKLIALLFGATLIAFAAGAAAEIPQTIAYQGVLRESGGQLVADGEYQLTFRIYPSAAGASPIWLESQVASVQGGIFDALLGSVASLAGLPFDTPYWLSVAIGADPELSPRTPLASVPYAMRSRPTTNVATRHESSTTIITGNVVKYGDCDVTLTVDGPGIVTVMSNAWVKLEHVAGIADLCYISISEHPLLHGVVTTITAIDVPSSWPSDEQYDASRTCLATFAVPAAGSYTYHLVGSMATGASANDRFWFAMMTASFQPASEDVVAAAAAAAAGLRAKNESE